VCSLEDDDNEKSWRLRRRIIKKPETAIEEERLGYVKHYLGIDTQRDEKGSSTISQRRSEEEPDERSWRTMSN